MFYIKHRVATGMSSEFRYHVTVVMVWQDLIPRCDVFHIRYCFLFTKEWMASIQLKWLISLDIDQKPAEMIKEQFLSDDRRTPAVVTGVDAGAGRGAVSE